MTTTTSSNTAITTKNADNNNIDTSTCNDDNNDNNNIVLLTDEETKMYNEWKEFLQSNNNRIDVQLAAIDAVLQVKDWESIGKIIQSNDFIILLAKNASYYSVNEIISLKALQALLHLLTYGGPLMNICLYKLQNDASGINRMIEIVLSKRPQDKEKIKVWNQRVNYAMAILANLTRNEHGAVELVGKILPEHAIPTTYTIKEEDNEEESNNNDDDQKLPTKPTLDLLMSRFLNPNYCNYDDIKYNNNPKKLYEYYHSIVLENNDDDNNKKSDTILDSLDIDPYQHFASVLMNSTQTQAGRQYILKIHNNRNDNNNKQKDSTNSSTTTTTSVLQTILKQLKHPNPIRRRGIAGTIRNCCLEEGHSWWLLNTVQIIPHILYPLAGPEELDIDEKQGLHPDLWLEGPDKVREYDSITRLHLIEIILLLCMSGRASREVLRVQRTYVILKYVDMVEEYEHISEIIYDCVNYLRRDEYGTEEGSSDKYVDNAYKKMLLLQQPSTSKQITTSSNNNNSNKNSNDEEEDFDNVD